MAINRAEVRAHLFRNKGEPMYVSGLAPFLEGYNPAWAQRFEQLYGYNPTRAKELLREAGYPPGTLPVKIWSFTQLAKPEIPPDVWARIRSGLPTYLIGPTETMNPDRPGTRLQDAADGPCVSAHTLLRGI